MSVSAWINHCYSIRLFFIRLADLAVVKEENSTIPKGTKRINKKLAIQKWGKRRAF